MSTQTQLRPLGDPVEDPEPAKPEVPAEIRALHMSIFDRVYLGIDDVGASVSVPLIYRNLLIGGEPGGGKSSLLNVIVAHGALSMDCRLCLFDGKQVELGQWESCADVFVGPDIQHAIATLQRLQIVMNNRYRYLRWRLRRKIRPGDKFSPILIAIDELAYYAATVEDKKLRELFSALLRDVVARGRAVGIIVIAATQRPSSDIIPTSLRDLFAYRAAFRCTTDSSSDIILANGWANRGWSATSISPTSQGTNLLLAEGGVPFLMRTAWLDDDTCGRIATYAAGLRAEAREQRLTIPEPNPRKRRPLDVVAA